MARPASLHVSHSSASAHQSIVMSQRKRDSVAYAHLTPPPTHSNSPLFSYHEFDDNDPTQSRAIRLLNLPDALLDLSSLHESTLSPLRRSAYQSQSPAEPSERPGPSSSADSSVRDLSHLLALLPTKRRRFYRTDSDALNAEERKEMSHPDAEFGIKSGPNSKRKRRHAKGDEASHLRGEEREVYERKRDDRLTHYKEIDAFELHTENVIWI